MFVSSHDGGQLELLHVCKRNQHLAGAVVTNLDGVLVPFLTSHGADFF